MIYWVYKLGSDLIAGIERGIMNTFTLTRHEFDAIRRYLTVTNSNLELVVIDQKISMVEVVGRNEVLIEAEEFFNELDVERGHVDDFDWACVLNCAIRFTQGA